MEPFTGKYLKYKTKYLELKNKNINYQIGGAKNNFIIIGNIRGNELEFIPQLKKKLISLNGNVFEYYDNGLGSTGWTATSVSLSIGLPKNLPIFLNPLSKRRLPV